MTLNNLGMLYTSLGENEHARTCYEEALSICIKVGDRAGEGWALNNLGRMHADLGKQEVALKCYEQALIIRREVGELGGEGETLYDIGKLYFEKNRYDAALAFLLLANSIFDEVQSPHREETQKSINALHKAISDEQFATLLAKVEPQAQEIVGQALREGME